MFPFNKIRQLTTDNPSMADPAFNGAGKKVGIEVWRIEELAPVKQAQVRLFHI